MAAARLQRYLFRRAMSESDCFKLRCWEASQANHRITRCPLRSWPLLTPLLLHKEAIVTIVKDQE